MEKIFKFLSLIIIVGFIKCLLLFYLLECVFTPGQQIGYFPDSAMYEKIADNILGGHGFSLSDSPPFKPTMCKEPLYPAFIAVVKSVPFINNMSFVIFLQILLNPLIAILIYLIGKELFNERIARISSFLVALLPAYGEMSFFIMPENIFTVLLCLTILSLVNALKSMRWEWFILSGFLLGLSSLCRNAAFPLFLIYPAAILIKNRDNKIKLLTGLILFIISFALVVAPWMMRNKEKLGLFSISRRGSEILSHQAFWAANFSAEEWKAYSLYLVSGNLAARLYPDVIGNNLGDYEYKNLMRTSYVERLLERYKEGDAEIILMSEAIRDIIRHPIKFLLLSGISYVQIFKYFESISIMLIKGPGGFEWMFSLFRLSLFIIGIVYTLLAFKGLFHSRKLLNTYPVFITIVYFHIALAFIGIIPGGLQRHILPVTVFYSFYVASLIDRENAYTLSKAI